MSSMIGIDTNAMRFLVDAMTIGGKPVDNKANEKIALLRTYIYNNDVPHISPTVQEEYKKIKDEATRKYHESIAEILLGEIQPSDSTIVKTRMREYNQIHQGKKNEKDCRILAESELGGCKFFLTYDKTFLKKLTHKTHNIKMMEPSQFWKYISISKNAKPIRRPHDTNPLSKETWWLWQ